MSELRWALLLIGLLILLGIYLYHQWKARTEVNHIFSRDAGDKKDVLFDSEMIEEDVQKLGKENITQQASAIGSTNHSSVYTTTAEIAPYQDQKERSEPDLFSDADPVDTRVKSQSLNTDNPEEVIRSNDRLTMVVMHIIAEKDAPFDGQAVIKALQAHKLRFGEQQIFHRILEEDGKKLTIYSVANMVKPGTLSPEDLKDTSVPGLTLILNLPAPIESLKAYDDMLHAAQHMSSTLGGSLLDEGFMTLSREKIALDRAKLF